MLAAGGVAGRTRRNLYEARLAVRREEFWRLEHPRRAGRIFARHRPLHRRQRIIGTIVERAERGDVEIARAGVFETGEFGVLAEDRRGALVIEAGKSHAAGDFANDP